MYEAQDQMYSNLKFIDIVAKWPGSTHNAFIWRQSGVNHKIANGEIPIVNGWFLDDSGYPLRRTFFADTFSRNSGPETVQSNLCESQKKY